MIFYHLVEKQPRDSDKEKAQQDNPESREKDSAFSKLICERLSKFMREEDSIAFRQYQDPN